MVDDLQVHAFQFKPFGKNMPKANRMSPDAFIQVALQLAYYRIYSQPAATSESASLRRYRLGRIDTIRSCTTDSVNFCKAMLNEKKTPSEKYRLLRKAVEAHMTYTNEVCYSKSFLVFIFQWRPQACVITKRDMQNLCEAQSLFRSKMCDILSMSV
ncbi:carnitine O-acetyltransferase-like [Ptychodera flava]|uniref:carnitine O-acetyltransferase-like n=1 Tax=Ptychodera flava TaxID=63121 RepID=UPI00396A92EA